MTFEFYNKDEISGKGLWSLDWEQQWHSRSELSRHGESLNAKKASANNNNNNSENTAMEAYYTTVKS